MLEIHPESPVAFPAQQSRLSSFWESFWAWTCARSPVPQTYPSQDMRWIAFLRTMSGGSRSHDTDEVLSDSYVRYHAMDFFDNTSLEQQWRACGLTANLPHLTSDWYSPPKLNADRNNQPGINFDTLCFFRLIRGLSGRIGLAPPRTKPSDKIVVLFGCSSPLLLVEDKNRHGHFRIRGEAFVHGFMFGEAIALWKQGRLATQNFHLI